MSRQIEIESSIQIHSDTPECGLRVTEDGEYFGILNVKPEKRDMSQNKKFILFTVDRTGSMSDGKMDYVKDTFKNMIKFIANQNADIYIQVNVFNTVVETCIESVLVTLENAEELIQKIGEIDANGTTSIDQALISASRTMTSYMTQNPAHSVYHVFMTDGEPTSGEKNTNRLVAMVSDQYPNAFIGFGFNHNSILLRKMSETNRGSYDFVDNMEHTGLVYGDILHNLMYPALTDVRIHIENGKLYDWKTNQWTNELFEHSLVCDMERNWHLKCTDLQQVSVKIFGKVHTEDEPFLVDTVYVMPPLMDIATGIETRHVDDLSRFVFRHAVLEKLYLAKSDEFQLSVFDRMDAIHDVKIEISELFSKLRKYMRDSDQTEDPMLRQLCDDLNITYRTMGTSQGRIMAVARQTSQGRQQSRNVSATYNSNAETVIPQYNNLITPLQHPNDEDEFDMLNCTGIRRRVDPFPNIQDSYSDDIDNYTPSEDPISCYATPKAVDTMRSMSQPYSN
jgi:hypothetical protein